MLGYSLLDEAFTNFTKTKKKKKTENQNNTVVEKFNDEKYYCNEYNLCENFVAKNQCNPLSSSNYEYLSEQNKYLDKETKEKYQDAIDKSMNMTQENKIEDKNISNIKSYSEDELDMYFEYDDFKDKNNEKDKKSEKDNDVVIISKPIIKKKKKKNQ